MKFFEFYWNKDSKYSEPIERKTLVKTPGDAKNALAIFCKNNGNLKKVNVVKILELDKNGKQIGEPILPMDNAIIPVAR